MPLLLRNAIRARHAVHHRFSPGGVRILHTKPRPSFRSMDLLLDLRWWRVNDRTIDRLQRHFSSQREMRGPLRLVDGDPKAKGIMWTCIAASCGVFLAWNYFLNRIPANNTTQPAKSHQRLAILTSLQKNFTLKTSHVKEHRYWTLLTASFSHIEPNHLIGNLFAFHAFSSVAIYAGLPALRYGLLIVGSAVSSHLAFLYQDVQRQRQGQILDRGGRRLDGGPGRAGLGLSGVVMSLGAVVSLAMPQKRMLLMGIVPVPMWALMAGYVVYDSARLNDESSRTGHAAHLGGAVFGAAYYFVRLRKGGR